jgi:hypothetical protein
MILDGKKLVLLKDHLLYLPPKKVTKNYVLKQVKLVLISNCRKQLKIQSLYLV